MLHNMKNSSIKYFMCLYKLLERRTDEVILTSCAHLHVKGILGIRPEFGMDR